MVQICERCESLLLPFLIYNLRVKKNIYKETQPNQLLPSRDRVVMHKQCLVLHRTIDPQPVHQSPPDIAAAVHLGKNGQKPKGAVSVTTWPLSGEKKPP